MNLVDKAYLFAQERHEGQFRWDGKTPYFEHCKAVKKFTLEYIDNVMIKSNINIPTDYVNSMKEKAAVAALLHDTVEDTNTTLQEIEDTFGKDIAALVNLLTHYKDVEYVDYIEILSNNELASIVKICDMKHNLETVTGNKRKLYQMATLYLQTNLKLRGAYEVLKLLGVA